MASEQCKVVELNKNPGLSESEQKELFAYGQAVLTTEAAAIQDAADKLDCHFIKAVEAVLNCRGRVCLTGMGKAGLVGRKIQATLASTGTLAYSLHPTEALHGDLGMVHPDDVVIALSKSGDSEVAKLVSTLKKIGCLIILLTAEPGSSAAQNADIVLSIGSIPEACPLGLAPSSSTTAMLALGDALALTVMKQKAIKPEEYAFYHQGGALGRALLKVREIMRVGTNCPRVLETDKLSDCYEAMLEAPLRAGATVVVDDTGKLTGILTQGDIFRLIARKSYPTDRRVSEIMTRNPKRIMAEQSALDALALMRDYFIDELPVVDDQGRLLGLLDVQDLIKHGFPIADSSS